MAPATITKLAAVRARLALVTARELARRVRFSATGDVVGEPAVLEALCRYIGAGARNCSLGRVWLAPRTRERLRFLQAGAGQGAA